MNIDEHIRQEARDIVMSLFRLGIIQGRLDTPINLVSLAMKVVFLQGQKYQITEDNSRLKDLVHEE
jgi:hypothetical protein